MIKILSAQQIRALDVYTIQHEPISSIDLMERACRAFVGWFTERFDETQKVAIVCGTGNNGGDGLGIARLLKMWGYPVNVLLIRGGTETEDLKTNLERLKGKVEVTEVASTNSDLFSRYDIVIDAIFGSGLSRPAEGIQAAIIQQMNQADAIRIAIDIPSGLQTDKVSQG